MLRLDHIPIMLLTEPQESHVSRPGLAKKPQLLLLCDKGIHLDLIGAKVSVRLPPIEDLLHLSLV